MNRPVSPAGIRRGYQLLAVGCAACSSNVLIPPPDMPAEVEWTALRFDTESGPRFSGLRPKPFRFELDEGLLDQATEVGLLGYSQEVLQRAGLDPVPTDALQPGTPDRAVLPGASFEARGHWAGASTVFGPEVARSAVSAPFLPRCPTDPCEVAAWALERPIPIPGSVIGIDVHWPGAPLAVTNRGQFFELREGSSGLEALELVALSTDASILATADSPEHGLWILSATALIQVTPDGLEVKARGFRLGQDTKVAVAQSGDLEVYFTSNEVGLYRYHDGVTEVISTEGGVLGAGRDTDVFWLGRGKAVAAFAATGLLVFYDNGRLTIEDRLDSPSTLAWMEGWGLIVGTETRVNSHGSIFRQEGLGWVELPGLPTEGVIFRGIWPIGPGFLFGGFRGHLGYYALGVGSCLLTNLTVGTIEDVEAMANQVLLGVGDRPESDLPMLAVQLKLSDVHGGCRGYVGP